MHLTEPFSQALCVSDSDETLSQDTFRTTSPSPVKEEQHSVAVVDLTTLSNSLNETVSSKRSELTETVDNTPGSLIVLSDSADSFSAELNCSTVNNSSHRLSSAAQARLNEFFDNIPSSVSDADFKLTETQLSDDRFGRSSGDDEGDKEVSVAETDASDRISPVDKSSEPEEQPSPPLRNVKVSAKIKIKVHVSEETSDESSSDESEKRQTDYREQKANQQGPQRAESPVIDDDMVQILTEIYGDKWRTPKNLALCQSQPKKAAECRKGKYAYRGVQFSNTNIVNVYFYFDITCTSI